MKKIFSSFKKAVNWYFDALMETSAMCPSCMIPPNGHICIYDGELHYNKHSRKAA